ncbi:hypothetical protein N7457_003122 [Penicillium paradoxum]|uniref:uncharacterized protein n=1 Tax=Penicillium paradoxum TaxID=176176 RepID=UPI002548C7E8|nr:uncharacterized protein N7457_003122 [Penicillium paradoxum]KAJ5788132.1 hypothetical protein N7457_003122 [Penicillium paradoxum]
MVLGRRIVGNGLDAALIRNSFPVGAQSLFGVEIFSDPRLGHFSGRTSLGYLANFDHMVTKLDVDPNVLPRNIPDIMLLLTSTRVESNNGILPLSY